MNEIDNDIAAFKKMKAELEVHHKGKWVLFHAGKFIQSFDNFNSAATEAVARFGAGPYLIREVDGNEIVLPASVVYNLAPHHA